MLIPFSFFPPVEAEDRDEGRNSELFYTLAGAGVEGLLSIDSYTGWVVTAGALDREAAATLNLTVVVVDGGSPSLNTTSVLLVHLVDCNDNPPIFSQDVYTVSGKKKCFGVVCVHMKYPPCYMNCYTCKNIYI